MSTNGRIAITKDFVLLDQGPTRLVMLASRSTVCERKVSIYVDLHIYHFNNLVLMHLRNDILDSVCYVPQQVRISNANISHTAYYVTCASI